TVFLLGIILRLQKSHRRLAAGLTLTLTALLMITALWIGVDVIVQRYSELLGEEGLIREGRIVVFRDVARMISDHPMGVGNGNFEDLFRKYQTILPNLIIDHAHNDYLETAAEWGVAPSLVFWIFIAFSLVRAIRLFVSVESPEKRGILLACIGAIF